LLKIFNHDYLLTIPKNEAIIFLADCTLFLISAEVVNQGVPLHALFFGFWIEVMDP
jgi:hypothetical protein